MDSPLEYPDWISSSLLFARHLHENNKVADRRIEFFMRWFRAADERRRGWGGTRCGGEGKCQGSLKLQSPSSRRLPGLNHLRSSLISGIDRHARDLVPPSPPPLSPPPVDLIYLVFQFNILSLVKLNKSLSLSISLSHSKYTHTKCLTLYFWLGCVVVFWMCVIGSLDDPPSPKCFN